MLLHKAIIKNYRSFTNVEITFTKKSLIIGANDVGKTNLMDALRLLLDRNLSEAELLPKDEDFCAYCDSDSFEITLQFTEITEECIYSRLASHIEDRTLFLSYIGTREGVGGKKDYILKAGYNIDSLQEIQGRSYLKVLNMRYVGANRQIDSFLRNQKARLLESLMSNRNASEIDADDEQWSNVKSLRDEIQSQLDGLSYIRAAGTKISEELQELSEHHRMQTMKMGVDVPNQNELLRRLKLISYVGDTAIQVGGEGRKNQAFLALWAAMNKIQKLDGEPEEVTILCIEEPEANLHPHQQRKLSEYLVNKFDSQVILTSHSPFIATDFSPNSIIRMHSEIEQATVIASKGASEEVGAVIENMEFRLNVISTEAYFSDCVFLVEGPSEVVFYKALASKIGIDLDKLNVSIVSVGGVGFERYLRLFNKLGIPCVIRTDNDYFKIRKKPLYRLAGIQRALSAAQIVNELIDSSKNDVIERILLNTKEKLTNLQSTSDEYRGEILQLVKNDFKEFNIFLANQGLEEDVLHQSPVVKQEIYKYFGLTEGDSDSDALEDMQAEKATFMYHFVKEHGICLESLRDLPIAEPLIHCQAIIGGLRDGQSNRSQ